MTLDIKSNAWAGFVYKDKGIVTTNGRRKKEGPRRRRKVAEYP